MPLLENCHRTKTSVKKLWHIQY